MEPNCSSAIGISSLSILSIILSQNVLVLFGINLKIERVRPIISSVAKLRFYEINCDNFVHAIVHDIYWVNFVYSIILMYYVISLVDMCVTLINASSSCVLFH